MVVGFLTGVVGLRGAGLAVVVDAGLLAGLVTGLVDGRPVLPPIMPPPVTPPGSCWANAVLPVTSRNRVADRQSDRGPEALDIVFLLLLIRNGGRQPHGAL